MLLYELIDQFYSSRDALGAIELVPRANVPAPYSSLLDHDDHMTVTMEAYHDSLVNVQVLETRRTEQSYWRKIVLHRQTDEAPVLFGLVRLNWRYLSDLVRAEIESCKTPLGRILIKHNLMRHIELLDLWHVRPSTELAEYLGSDEPTYGRTAIIHVEKEPAIELFEIAAPVAT
jgi:chorismate-pyruvate lyase